jgi:hypothetical protein
LAALEQLAMSMSLLALPMLGAITFVVVWRWGYGAGSTAKRAITIRKGDAGTRVVTSAKTTYPNPRTYHPID